MKLFEVAIPDSSDGSWTIDQKGVIDPGRDPHEVDDSDSITWQSGVNITLHQAELQSSPSTGFIYIACCRYLTSAAKQALLKFMAFIRTQSEIIRVMVDLFLLDDSIDVFLTPLGPGEIFDDVVFNGSKSVRQAAAYISQTIQPLEASPDRDW